MALEVFDSRTDVRNLFITPEIRARVMRFQPGEVSHGHTHDLGHELFVVLEGQAEFTIAGESAVLGPGQICVARAGEWHEIRTQAEQPMTLYLSVTPHIEPTHTQWDREGGTRLPYRYGSSTRAERFARSGDAVDPRALLETAIEELHRQFGEGDSDTVASVGNLAAILWQFGERGEAYWLQAQLVEAQRRVRGEDDPATRAALAVLAAMQHDGMP